MKQHLLISVLILCALSSFAQSKKYKYGITAGGYVQHYSGNLGSSFFKFNTVGFCGVSGNFGMYLNKSFDFNAGLAVGDFGFCQAHSDNTRVVAKAHRCPGCKNKLGMGDLRSRMMSANLAVKYKLANGIFLSEKSKFCPYVYLGMGINHLSDNMKRNCVNSGFHFTVNGGVGMKYALSDRINIGYNLGVGCFLGAKVYNTTASSTGETVDSNELSMQMRNRPDMYLQNTLFLGINFK
jgi:hypothetical protein